MMRIEMCVCQYLVLSLLFLYFGARKSEQESERENAPHFMRMFMPFIWQYVEMSV